MAGNFGDVLRGLGSVLNPQVMQQVEAEDNQKQQQSNKIQDMLLQQELVKQSPEYQMRVQQLKNEQGFRGAVQQAGGDETKIASAAMEFGKPEVAMSIIKNKEDRAARIQDAHDKLEQRKKEFESNTDLKKLTLEQKARYDEMMGGIKQQQLDLQKQLGQQTYDLKKMQFEMQGDKQLVQNTRNLSKDLERANLPTADAVLTGVEDALKKNPDLAEYISGPKSKFPDYVVGKDIGIGRQAFDKLFNITLKDRSGAAVTNQELERLKQEFAAGVFKTKGQLEGAIEQARNIINKHYASISAGYGTDVLNAYNENLRGLGGKVVLEPNKATNVGPAKITSDAEYSALPSGATYIAPDGSTRKKQ